MIRIAILLSLAAMVFGTMLSWRFLGWWTFLAIPVAIYLFFRLAGGWLLKQALLVPFRAKGAALRGATATVHFVRPYETPPPSAAPGDGDAEEDADESRAGWRWFRVEATVVQREDVSGPFVHWEPGEIRLGAPDCDPVEDKDEDRVCDVREVEIEREDGAFGPHEGMKFAGPLRLRILLRARPDARDLVFTYYFEKFGGVRLAG